MKTDAQLQQDVSAELKSEPCVHASQIGVVVKDGVVTLYGEVSSYAEKWNAQLAAQRVAGVRALAIELTMKRSGFGERTDADIARSAENILQCSPCLPEDAINVMVEGGRITLSGAVNGQYQKKAAVDAVRSLLGVTGLSDQIALRPDVSIEAVKAQIEAALQRCDDPDTCAGADHLRGAAYAKGVTFSGTVHSLSEHIFPAHSAWDTVRVGNVIDK
jgi:osmotically-inducible protein OsmY